MKTKQLIILLGLVLSVTPSFGQRLQITDWMAFDKAKNHFVATERIQKKGDKARMLKEANVVVDSLIEFARRTGNKEEILIDTAFYIDSYVDDQPIYKDINTVGKKMALVKIMDISHLGRGTSVVLPSVYNGYCVVYPSLRNLKHTFDIEFPASHNLHTTFGEYELNLNLRTQNQGKEDIRDGFMYKAPHPEIICTYNNLSPFDGLGEEWALQLETYLLISVANQTELLYSIVNKRDNDSGEEFFLTMSRQEAEKAGISNEEYDKLNAYIQDKDYVKAVLPDKKILESEKRILDEVMNHLESLYSGEEMISYKERFVKQQKMAHPDWLDAGEWRELRDALMLKDYCGGSNFTKVPWLLIKGRGKTSALHFEN